MAKKKAAKRVARPAATEGQSGRTHAVPHSGSPVVEHVQKAPCSLEFSRDAKGQPRWALKVYGERDEMGDVVDEVLDLDATLRERTSGEEA